MILLQGRLTQDTIIVVPGAIAQSETILVSVIPEQALFLDELQLVVAAHDKFANQIVSGGALLVMAVGADRTVATDTNDGLYNAEFSLGEVGNIQVRIELEALPIRGMPTSLAVLPTDTYCDSLDHQSLRTSESTGVPECVCVYGFVQSGDICERCPPGTQPNEIQTTCVNCPPGLASIDGVCEPCADGLVSSDGVTCAPCSELGTFAKMDPESRISSCVPCPAFMEPNEARNGCNCKSGTYDQSSLGLLQCGAEPFTDIAELESDCRTCQSCFDCATAGMIIRKEGWAMYAPQLQNALSSDEPIVMYPCPLESACPATVMNVSGYDVDLNYQCAEGYAGATCADCCSVDLLSCAEDWNHLSVGQECKRCADGIIELPLVLATVLVGIAGAFGIALGGYNYIKDNGMLTVSVVSL
eukprot:SAG31_NODE_218_length_19934_cov_81.634837_10_plen_415_part_00